ncbi:MAG: porin [Gammaproteobacteria bacterium]|nr:MAG: porin [Gammaproteobacteria bacterium]
MKKLLLTTAIAALSVTAAQAAPTVYGKAGVKVQYQEDGDVTLDTNTTRFGLTGSEAITANTDFVYKAEFGFDIDSDGNDGEVDFKQRDTYVGLANDQMGTVVAGRLTAIDDVINFTNPSEYKDAGVLGSFDGGRLNNAMAYFSPDMDGVQLMAMYKMTDSDDGAEDNDGDLSGSYGVGAKYEKGPLAAGITYIKADDGADWDDIRVSGAYDLTNNFTLSGLYQVIDFDGADEKENAYIVAGEYDVPGSKWTVYGEYDGVTNAGGVEDADADVYSVGGDYAFTQATKGQVFLGLTDTGDDESVGGGVGIVHKF